VRNVDEDTDRGGGNSSEIDFNWALDLSPHGSAVADPPADDNPGFFTGADVMLS